MSSVDQPAWSEWVERACAGIEASGRWRAPRTFDPRDHEGPLVASAPDRDVVSFASNDYLGLTTHPTVVAAAHQALDRWGTGSGASRLVTGSRPVHQELEAALADWKGAEAAVLFPTGFAANLSVLSVFASDGVVVHSDELNHASIIDGCRLARADVRIVPHGDLDALDASLGTTTGRSVVVSDTVFSMDGDTADIDGLVAAARRHGALLILDEAHAVLGPELGDTDRGRRAPGGHPVEDARVAGRFRGRPGPLHGPVGESGAPVHLHHGTHPGRRRRRVGGPRGGAVGRG